MSMTMTTELKTLRIASHLLLAAILLFAFRADAQQQAKIIKIGWLVGGPGRSAQFETYKKALRALGYIEGKNIAFEYRFQEEGKPDQRSGSG